jgi:hypothetical protein
MSRRLRKCVLTLSALSTLLLSFFARTQVVPAPSDVILELWTDGNYNRFHLGELINMKYSYRAEVPGKYVWVSQNKKLEGGRGLEISCSPSPPADPIDSWPQSPSFSKFNEMLNAPCGGVGSGSGGGCGDCDSELPLTTAAISFGPILLNRHIRFRIAGTYSCVASSADVTMVLPNEKIRPALLVKSDPVVLTLVNDPEWARSAARAYGDTYDMLCRDLSVSDQRLPQCWEIAARIAYMDTPESLATMVRFYKGQDRGWDNGFWEAIVRTSYRAEALILMTKRMQDTDVEVSPALVTSLAMWELERDLPETVETTSIATYHPQAVDKMRKYVRLLGESLSRKDATALPESVKTYRYYADQEYCENQPLIPKQEQNQVLVTLRP